MIYDVGAHLEAGRGPAAAQQVVFRHRGRSYASPVQLDPEHVIGTPFFDVPVDPSPLQ